MTGEIGLECRKINMILKLDQYTGNKRLHCYDKSNVKWLLEELPTKKTSGTSKITEQWSRGYWNNVKTTIGRKTEVKVREIEDKKSYFS